MITVFLNVRKSFGCREFEEESIQLPCDATFGDLKIAFPFTGEFYFRKKISLIGEYAWQDMLDLCEPIDSDRNDFVHFKAYGIDKITAQTDDNPDAADIGDDSFPQVGWWSPPDLPVDKHPTSIIDSLQSNFIVDTLSTKTMTAILAASQSLISSSASSIEKYVSSMLATTKLIEIDNSTCIDVTDATHLKLLSFIFTNLINDSNGSRMSPRSLATDEMLKSRCWLRIGFSKVPNDLTQVNVLVLKLLEFMVYQHHQAISDIIRLQQIKTRHHYPVISVVKNISIMLFELYKDSYEGFLILSSASLFRLNELWSQNPETTRDDFGRLILQVRNEVMSVLADVSNGGGLDVDRMMKAIRRHLFVSYEFQPRL